MVIGIKDISKMIGITIIACCAVFVCTLFLNYNIDLASIEEKIANPEVKIFYDAQVMTGKVVSGISGGCLLLTSVVMLFFYIKYYIDSHKKELGILKALGYSNLKIAKGFWVFGLCIFIGTAAGYLIARCFLPSFYEIQNEKEILPKIIPHFHFVLVNCLIILPTLFFSLLSIFYSYYKLKTPVIDLLKEKTKTKVKVMKETKGNKEMPFIEELKKSTVRQRKSLVFFIFFAAFCYSDMIQMSFSMDELSSVFFAILMITIGIILACVTMFLATTTVVNANIKTIAMMKVFGYQINDCTKAILGGYRLWAYIGFALGTVYQYGLLRLMVDVVFKDVSDMPVYNFNVKALIFTLITFAVIYELIMYFYSRRIKKIPLKEIMLES